MTQVSKHPLEPKVEDKVFGIFINSIKNVQSTGDVVSFLNDLLTKTEKTMLAKRVTIAFLLIKGERNYREISKVLRVSLGTIAKVHAVLILEGTGYKKILTDILNEQTLKQMVSEIPDILKPLPSKGQTWGSWQAERRKKEIVKEKENPL